MMMLPVSKYEELLETVRSLKQQTIRVRELASPLLDTIISANTSAPAGGASSSDGCDVTDDDCLAWCGPELGGEDDSSGGSGGGRTTTACRLRGTKHRDVMNQRCSSAMESLMVDRQHKTSLPTQIYDECQCGSRSEDFKRPDGSCDRHMGTHMSVSSDPESSTGRNVAMLYHGTWPVERAMWNSEPPNLNHHNSNINQADMTSVMSFASSSGATPLDKVLNGAGLNRPSSQQHLEVKVDMVYSLLSMLGTQECPDMGETLLALSSSPESSLAMRQAGCLPVLVQLVYSEKDQETREKASKALYNLVQVQPDDKLKKREVKVLRLLEEIRSYCSAITDVQETDKEIANNHPSQVTENIIKLSFDEGYRQTICELGGIYALAHLVEVDHLSHTESPESDQCVTLRRYAGMALTNLTFGHSQNKALLCSFREFMACLVVQLKSNSDELRQVTASVLRNLSWRADASSRMILREVASVPALMSAAMISRKESTLKSILSALWNLSAHCSMNKADICSVDGALGFLVDMLSYKPPSKTLTIIENAGGILRNISSHIAVREDYRAVLREHNCLQVLLQQLKSPSLTIVSNACGTLWNLSAKCAEDQKALWDMGAAPMLRSLNHSKHIMIATGSRAALKNLLSSRPSHNLFSHVDSTAKELGLPALPTLGARKQRALAKDLDQNLAETCENIEPTSPPMRENFSLGETSKTSAQCHRKFKYPVKKDGDSLDSASVTHSKRTSLTNDDSSLIETFGSLTLSDRCTSKVIDSDSDNAFVCKSQVYQQTSYSSNSLPYTATNCTRNSRTSTAYIPHMRNKFSDCTYEDEQDTQEQPVDYSQKYSETKLQITKNYSSIGQSSSSLKDETAVSETKQKKEYMYHGKCQKTNVTYSDYAETDLDQPTDYSLRYAENDSDAEDVCKSSVNRSERFYEEQQDTVKTYCTEGTPYETPYNFSTATSMSDLRIDQSAEEDKEKKKDNEKEDKVLPVDNKDKKFEQPDKSTPTDNCTSMQDKKLKSCFSSGLMTPEKPVNYCEEGTPGCFSRVSSFSSLNMEEPSAETKVVKVETDVSVVEDEAKMVSYVEPETEHDTSIPDEAKSETKVDREEAAAAGKVVTFDRVVDYAEETPLMFSRCSSLGSLSSTEQHSIHDDRSSVVSDFSRLTSGIVSPSELPDSPTQTVPPSPRHRKAPLEFPNIIADAPPQPQEKSVFEDNVIKYKEVNTPVEFSTNTSLSSLTIDDEPSIPVLSILQNAIARQSNSESSVPASVSVMDKASNDAEKNTSNGGGCGSSGTDLLPVSEGEEEAEDDMLAACINIGMQNNRHRQNKQLASPKHRSGIPSALPKYTVKPPSPRTGIPVKSGIPTRATQQESRLPLSDSRMRTAEANSDTTRTYCTEDTPAMLSHAGSQSDLSVLSISSKDKPAVEREDKPDFSDDSSNLSGDNDNILAECIQSGMPKARRQLVQPKIVSHKSRPINRGNIPEPVSNPVAIKNSVAAPRTNDMNLQQRIFKNVAYIGAKDEVESYAVEDSPCHFSLRSSLSDLTVDGTTAAAQQQQSRRREDRGSFDKPEQPYRRDYDPYASPVYMAGSSKDTRKKSPDRRSFSNEASAFARRPEEPGADLSRQDSLSSLSVDSFGSTENAEQALLEQCISSGMPKSKNTSSNKVVIDLVGASSKSLLMKNNTSHNSSNNRHLSDSTHSSSRHSDTTHNSARHLDSNIRHSERAIENSSKHLDTNRYAESNATSRNSSRQHNVETTNRHFDTNSYGNNTSSRYSNSVSEAATDMMTTTAGSKNVYVASVVTSTMWIEPVQQGPITARATGVAIESRARTDTITDGAPVAGTLPPIHSNSITSSSKNDRNDTIPTAQAAVNITSTIRSMRNGSSKDTNINDNSENAPRTSQLVANGYNIQTNSPQNITETTSMTHFFTSPEPGTPANLVTTHADSNGYNMQTSTPINNESTTPKVQIPFTPGDLYTPTKTHTASGKPTEPSSRFDTAYSFEETNDQYTSNLIPVQKPFFAEYRDIKDTSTVVEGNLMIQTTKTGYKVTENSVESVQDTAYVTAIEKFSTTIDENLLTEETKSYPDKCSDLLLDGSVEENGELSDFEKNKIAQNRMLDPDAMIESLDRFTAELVSQSSHLQHSHHECKLENMMHSGNECGDTWNDDTSPNDISFPSISISAPLAGSFKSECDQEEIKNNLDDEEPLEHSDDVLDGRFKSLESNTSSDNAYESNQFEITVKEPEESNQFSSLSTVLDTTMSDSTLIAMEATKIVNVVRSEVEMVQSVTSIASLELDHVKPPSVMENLLSLTSSMSELGHQVASAKNSPVPSRKKSLPAGLMVRRALSNSTHNAKSLENLADNASSVSSSCNLDHVKPPSVMGDYLDMIDMENSMISVASITSEVADVKTDFLPNGPVTKDLYELNTKNSHSNWLFEVKQPNIMHLLTNSTQCHSVTDIENINPPSLLNEVTDLCNSTADFVTENVYSETDVFEDCFTHTIDQTLKNTEDMTEYSDANSITPIQSDFATSSAESTPKKVKNLNRLTPKQRRQLARERYRTYTVAAEMVIREENKAKLDATYENCSPDSTTTGTTSETKYYDNNNSSNTSFASPQSPKITPKERRQLDRARFQTRVLDGTFSPQFSPELTTTGSSASDEQQSSPISKLDIRKAMRQKRMENKDRFRTRTLSSDEVSLSPELSPAPDRRNITTDDLHMMLEHEANIVLDTLKQSHQVNGGDELLDCETLSLVSNDDESEHNSVSSINYRTYHKSWGFSKNLPVVQSATDVSNAVTANQDLISGDISSAENGHVTSETAIDDVSVSEHSEQEQEDEYRASDEDDEDKPKNGKPKIVKPDSEPITEDTINEEDNEAKAIRGRRKALFSSPNKKPNPPSKLITKNIKPIKTMTSNLVKNVTSTLKTNTVNKTNTVKQVKPGLTAKPPVAQSKPFTSKLINPKTNVPKTSSDIPKSRKPSPGANTTTESVAAPKLERQGTFTKDEKKQATKAETKIPLPSSVNEKPATKIAVSKIARAIPGKTIAPVTRSIPKPQSISTAKVQSKKIASSTTKATETASKSTFYTRSPSADRDFGFKSRKTGMHGSTSSQSLQNGDGIKSSYTSKRSSIPNMTQRSNSNVSITSTESNGKKKAVTSKISSLWKRNEDSKKQIQKTTTTTTVTSTNNVKMRNKNAANSNPSNPKRLSRLGSFIQVEEIVVDTPQSLHKTKIPVT